MNYDVPNLPNVLKCWTIYDEEELGNLRAVANERYIKTIGEDMLGSEIPDHFVSLDEEQTIIRWYIRHLPAFSRRYQPPVPKSLIETAQHYFKRFYIRFSVMDYHPKEMMLTCLFWSSKIEKNYISLEKLIPDRDKKMSYMDFIVYTEMLLFGVTKFSFLTYSPLRHVENLLTDIEGGCTLGDIECIRPEVEHFLNTASTTDAVLLYDPNTIAIAAILHAASKLPDDFNCNVTDQLLGDEYAEKLKELLESVAAIQLMVNAAESLPEVPRCHMELLEKKLDKCRNPENNPESFMYVLRSHSMFD